MTIYRIHVVFPDDINMHPVPSEYARLDGRYYKTIEYAARAVADAYETVYRHVPLTPGATIGPDCEREYFGKTVNFPRVRVVRIDVEESVP